MFSAKDNAPDLTILEFDSLIIEPLRDSVKYTPKFFLITRV